MYIYLLLDFDSALVQGIDFESKGDKLLSSAECKSRTFEVWDTKLLADWMPTHKPAELLRIKLKTWTQQPVPMMSEHSAHLTSLLELVHPWIWRYPVLPKLIRFYTICTSCTLSFRDYISLRHWAMGSRYQRCSFLGEIEAFHFEIVVYSQVRMISVRINCGQRTPRFVTTDWGGSHENKFNLPTMNLKISNCRAITMHYLLFIKKLDRSTSCMVCLQYIISQWRQSQS